MIDLGLADRSVLVTGSSSGIGLSIARVFAAEKCRLCLVARSEAKLQEIAHELESVSGRTVGILPIDLTLPGASERVADRFSDVDILVNNAGDIPGGTLEDVTEASWRAAWDLKVYGYINLSRAYFTRMKPRGGVIVNVIGAAGELLDANYIAGSVGNAALMAFTRALGATSLDHNIRVVGVNPGAVLTERLITILKSAARRKFGDETRWSELERLQPLGRAAKVEEIAQAIAFLASPLSAYVSGTVLTIDGGASNRRSIS